MEILFIYFAKSIFISAVFWLYYVLFLQGKEFHHYNRFFLLAATVLSLVLPLIKVDWFTIQPDNENIYQLLLLMNGSSVENTTDASTTFSFWHFTALILGIVSLFFIVKFGVSIYKIQTLKTQYPNEKHKDYNLIMTDLEFAPFTFLKNLFWNKSIDTETHNGQKIFMHELAHIKQKHTFDRVFLQILKAVFWFNPVFYLINKEVMLIHEYLADQKAIANRDSKAFAAMLLNQHYYKTAIAGTSPFFSSTIKKRLDMLTKNHTTKFSYARRIWALPLVFLLSFVYLVQAKNKEIKTENELMNDIIENTKPIFPEKSTSTLESSISQERFPEIIEQVDNDSLKKALRTKQRELKEAEKRLAKEANEIKSLNKDLKKKNREMRRLLSKSDKNLNEREVKAKMMEIEMLQSEIDHKVKNSNRIITINTESMGSVEELVDDLANHTKIVAYFDSDEWKDKVTKIELNAEKLNEFFESEEWQSELAKIEFDIEEIEEYFESDEWEEVLEELEEINEQPVPPSPPTPPTSPNAPAPPKSPTPPKDGRVSIRFDKDYDYTLAHNGKGKITSNLEGYDMTYKINGKVVTKEDVEKLDGNKIESISINKDNNEKNGVVTRTGTVKIKTK